MTRTPFWPGVGLLLVVPILIVSALGSEPAWVEIRSPHFSVVTDAGEKRGRDAAFHFEEMRAVFGALLFKAKVTLPTPLQIVAFRNTKELRQFAPLYNGKPTQVAGLFEGNTDRSFILLDMSVEDPWTVVFHEYAHQLLNGNTDASVQPWFDEGFAEFFSTIKVNGKEADVGLTQQNDFQILQHDRMFRVADLFRVQQNSSVYNESGDHRSMFYAESWLVMHYLFDRKLVAKAGPYFDLAIDRRVPVEDAIQQAFGMSAAQFDKELRDYLDKNHLIYWKIATPAGIESTGYTVKPVSIADARAMLADVHLHSSFYQEKAVAEFEEVLKLQPDNAAALRGMGYACMMKRDFSRAGEYFNQATEHDSDDPRVLYYSGLLAQMQNGPALGGDPAQLVSMQKKLERSVALAPEFADTYSVLAFNYASQGKYTSALITMSKAVALNPRSEQYRFNLAQMYLANKKADPALQILQPLQNSSDPGVAERARQAMAQAQAFKQAMQGGAEPVRRVAVVPASGVGAEHPAVIESQPLPAKAPPPVNFLKGRLTAVDCSAPASALLTLISGTKTWKLKVQDREHVVVIGADNFSCAWNNQAVAVNYRATGETNGDVVSIEVE
jgi:Flp pilus assembly protein TadD